MKKTSKEWKYGLPSTLFATRNKEKNKIIVYTNLRVLAMFFLFAIWFDHYIVYKAHIVITKLNIFST